MAPLKNRKQRQAAATNTASIPLSHPSRESPIDKPKPKTLVDIIAERQSDLSPETAAQNLEFMTVDPTDLPKEDKAISKTDTQVPSQSDNELDQPLPPFLDTILLSFPLTTLHLTLAYLAAHQYADEIHIPRLLKESALIAFPTLTLLIHLAHGHIISITRRRRKHPAISLFPLTHSKLSPSFVLNLIFPPTHRTLSFLSVAIVLGSKLVAITNNEPYYAVMKKAPAIGTLWVWAILEMPLGAAVLGALGPLGWGVWWMGYGIL